MIQALERIGLTSGEIKVYLALLELGSTSTGKITKISGISGSKVYEVLDRLSNKGLCTHIINNGVKHFEAADPNRILDYLQEKENQIEEEKTSIQKIIPELLMKRKDAQQSVAKIYSGWEGMKTANEDIINTLKKGQEWLSLGFTEQPKSWEIHFNKRQIIRAKKGIIHKALHNEKSMNLYKTRKTIPHTQYRFLPKEWGGPTTTEIYANKVAFYILNPNAPMVVIIENNDIAESYRKYFYALWESARRPK